MTPDRVISVVALLLLLITVLPYQKMLLERFSMILVFVSWAFQFAVYRNNPAMHISPAPASQFTYVSSPQFLMLEWTEVIVDGTGSKGKSIKGDA